MTLTLYYHPFSSFCQKVLVALYERDVPFEGVVLDHSDAEQKAAFERLWPMGKFPVLRDEARGVTVPESSVIVEYLDRVHSGPPPLVPADPDSALKARQWDRFFDHYVEVPLQKIVGDTFRPEGGRDPHGVEDANAVLGRAYDLLEEALGEAGEWIAGTRSPSPIAAPAPLILCQYGRFVCRTPPPRSLLCEASDPSFLRPGGRRGAAVPALLPAALARGLGLSSRRRPGSRIVTPPLPNNPDGRDASRRTGRRRCAPSRPEPERYRRSRIRRTSGRHTNGCGRSPGSD